MQAGAPLRCAAQAAPPAGAAAAAPLCPSGPLPGRCGSARTLALRRLPRRHHLEVSQQRVGLQVVPAAMQCGPRGAVRGRRQLAGRLRWCWLPTFWCAALCSMFVANRCHPLPPSSPPQSPSLGSSSCSTPLCLWAAASWAQPQRCSSSGATRSDGLAAAPESSLPLSARLDAWPPTHQINVRLLVGDCPASQPTLVLSNCRACGAAAVLAGRSGRLPFPFWTRT